MVTGFDLEGMGLGMRMGLGTGMGMELGPFGCMFKAKVMSNNCNVW